jgi:colanic acid/amylovoran biosynthesis glycosyltransferase
MIRELGPDVATIATFGVTSGDGPPAIDLGQGMGPLGHRFGAVELVAGLGSRSLERAITTHRPDVLLFHYANLATHFVDLIEAIGIPSVVHVHGYDLPWPARRTRAWGRRRRGARYVDRLRRLGRSVTFVANSSLTRDVLTACGVDEGAVRVNHLGVPIERTAPRPHVDLAEVQPSTIDVLYLGRLVDFKGPIETLRAFELAVDGGLDATLTMAGAGPLSGACRRAVRRSPHRDRIRLLGAVDADRGGRLRAQADIFTAHNTVSPSSGQMEAFGVAVVEAMADSLPVVTGRAGAVCETVVDGRTGVLVDSGDVAAHAAALVELAESAELRTEMGRAGWERARSMFSLERSMSGLRTILAEAT